MPDSFGAGGFGSTPFGGGGVAGPSVDFFTAHAGDPNVRKWTLVRIGFSPVLYLTDCDVSIEWAGTTWTSSSLQVGAVTNQPDGQSASFSLGDADGSVLSLLSTTNGGEQLQVDIYEAGFLLTNQTPTPDGVQQIFSGRIDTTSNDTTSTDVVQFTCMPPVLQNAAFLPTRLIAGLVRTA
jgi:hypothetical protein